MAQRTVRDSMGEMLVPEHALWGAQTQRAVVNFPISGEPMPIVFVETLIRMKSASATANEALGLLPADIASAIRSAAERLLATDFAQQFPVDVFQTGSGTSTNMNANEVLSTLATEIGGVDVHPNDHVNLGQSSNDTIPTAIHVSAHSLLTGRLLPALDHLADTIAESARRQPNTPKTGRTHLMDAVPIRVDQELNAWRTQVLMARERLESVVPRLSQLAQGGTAVGTGLNCHPEFPARFCAVLNDTLGSSFRPSDDFCASLSSQDTAVELSGQLKTLAVALMKISNDLRLMNSGPLAGLSEVNLPALQPGSSIMPGKVNPVIPEACAMVAAQVIGNDTTVTVAGQSGLFQLNVMLPVIARNLLESLSLLSAAARLLADTTIRDMTFNLERINAVLDRNPILVTALNAEIGYERGAEIVKSAYRDNRPILDVAIELTDLDREQLERLLDPLALTRPKDPPTGSAGG